MAYKIKLLLIVLLSQALCACSNISLPGMNQDAVMSTTERVDESTILFKGKINRFSVDQFRNMLTPSTKTVLLDSPGGYALSAIEMANTILDRGLDTEVVNFCASSCANYLFVAGRNKIIRKNAMVVWHGSGSYFFYSQKIKNKEIDETKQKLYEEIVRKEKKFFERVGVDEFASWFGMLPPYNTWIGYTLSQDDMEKFGIHGIKMQADYPATSSVFRNFINRIQSPKLNVDWKNMGNMRSKAYDFHP